MNRIIRYTQPAGGILFPVLENRNRWLGFDRDAGRLLEGAFADFTVAAQSPRLPVDLYEDKENTYVRATLPGTSREAIGIELVDGRLNLEVQRKDGEKSYALARSISVPEGVQADKITAAYENGVLTVTLPKQEQAKPQKINITVN